MLWQMKKIMSVVSFLRNKKKNEFRGVKRKPSRDWLKTIRFQVRIQDFEMGVEFL